MRCSATRGLRMLYKKLSALLGSKPLGKSTVLLLMDLHAGDKPSCITALQSIIKTLTYASRRGAPLPTTARGVVSAPEAALAARNAAYRETHLARATVHVSPQELAMLALHEQSARKCKGGFTSQA